MWSWRPVCARLLARGRELGRGLVVGRGQGEPLLRPEERARRGHARHAARLLEASTPSQPRRLLRRAEPHTGKRESAAGDTLLWQATPAPRAPRRPRRNSPLAQTCWEVRQLECHLGYIEPAVTAVQKHP